MAAVTACTVLSDCCMPLSLLGKKGRRMEMICSFTGVNNMEEKTFNITLLNSKKQNKQHQQNKQTKPHNNKNLQIQAHSFAIADHIALVGEL